MTRIVAIDWSGARTGAERRIRLAEARRSHAGAVELLRVEGDRDRDRVVDHLLDLSRAEPDLVAGFDFAFGFPTWFLEARACRTGPDGWALAEREGESWLAECPDPFWGRPGRPRPDLPAHLRDTEREVAAVGGISPKSVFQVGGAGSVGTGSIRGMPYLRRLRDAGWRIWPFDDPEPGVPLAVEIWPRVLTGPVRKSRRADRAAWVDATAVDVFGTHVPDRLRDAVLESEDAFDAAASAIGMVRGGLDRAAPAPVVDPVRRREGAIWIPPP